MSEPAGTKPKTQAMVRRCLGRFDRLVVLSGRRHLLCDTLFRVLDVAQLSQQPARACRADLPLSSARCTPTRSRARCAASTRTRASGSTTARSTAVVSSLERRGLIVAAGHRARGPAARAHDLSAHRRRPRRGARLARRAARDSRQGLPGVRGGAVVPAGAAAGRGGLAARAARRAARASCSRRPAPRASSLEQRGLPRLLWVEAEFEDELRADRARVRARAGRGDLRRRARRASSGGGRSTPAARPTSPRVRRAARRTARTKWRQRMTDLIEARELRKRFRARGKARRGRARRQLRRPGRARSSASSGPTAPARRRRCGC